MSVQKAVENINKVITLLEEHCIDDLTDTVLISYLTTALEELKTSKELGWETVEKCECGKDSLPGFDVIPDRYFCKECFFKQIRGD